jgi:muramoyltetrapeptide carboxypeptidase
MKEFTRREFIPLAGLTMLSASCLSATKEPKLFEEVKRLPRKLSKGDVIGICAPAGAVKESSEVDDFITVLTQMGFKVKLGKNVRDRFGYFSADDKSRADEFMELVKDKEVNGVFFVRGGWGCARILEHLDFQAIRENPKVIMGFSDITTLLNAITTKTGMVTFHGPGGNSSWNPYSVSYIKEVLMEGKNITFLNKSYDSEIRTISTGKAIGELYGGNLSVISGLIGSDYLPDWNNKILFLEDVMEEPYRIDRMLTQLKLAGIFDKVSGVALGVFRKCTAEEPEFSFTLEEVFDQHFTNAEMPVLSGLQFGHTKNKFTLPVGTQVELNSDRGSLQMMEPAVY